jgi:hypothetical protein
MYEGKEAEDKRSEDHDFLFVGGDISPWTMDRTVENKSSSWGIIA